ncbi:MAG: type II toxin-antitoxin system RelE/ParE family toxin [Marinobacter sp.]|uniref:type II toxin-antitoxin system RelE/ParE family toxin n=1 Tax=Marinobacter sp. TaxID=50741 RepID=UPI003F9AA07C
MRNYDLTDEAESDLRQIIRYTLEKWGAEQAHNYRAAFSNTLEAIGNQTLVGMTFSDNLPAIRVVKSQHHYIFTLYKTIRARLFLLSIMSARTWSRNWKSA